MNASPRPAGSDDHPDLMAQLKARASDVAALLRQLAHPTRLLLLCQISQGERAVSQLETETGLRQPGLSQQLAELREAGLVRTRRVSRQVFYAIADARALALLHTLHALYCGDPALQSAPSPLPGSAPAAVLPAAATPPVLTPDRALPGVRADVARFARIE